MGLMPTVIRAAIALALGLAPGGRSAAIPRFEDHRVPTPLPARKGSAFIGRAGQYDRDETAAHFHSRIWKAAKHGPDFAGHYAIVGISCGSGCQNSWIVDVQTGKIYNTPFVGASLCLYGFDVPLLSYSLDSSLLLVTGSLEIPDGKSFTDGPCGKYYYHWDQNRLKLIHSIVRTKSSYSFK